MKTEKLLIGLSFLSACAFAVMPPCIEKSRLIAHRGDSLEAPENTFPAFKRALEGGYGVELDLYFTLDNEIFMTHDFHARTFTKKYGLTHDATNYLWKGELDAADAGKWFEKKWTNTPFARIDEVLAIVPTGRRIVCDMKCSKEPMPRLMRAAISRHPQIKEKDIIFLSTDPAMMKLFPESTFCWCTLARRGWKKDDAPIPVEEMIARAKSHKVNALSVLWDREVITADFIKAFKAAGMEVHVWTINDPRDAALALERGVTMITSDSPRRLQELWEETFTPPPAPPTGAYRMLVFNIWGPFFGNPVAARRENVIETIRRENPDVFGFQEMTPKWWESGLPEELAKMGYDVVKDGWETENRHHDSTPLFYRKSRLQVVVQGHEIFHFKLDASKGYTWAMLRDIHTKKMFTAFSTHFWWKTNGEESNVVRLQNAEKFVAGMDRVRTIARTPVIGGGDFNMREGADALLYLADRGFVDAQKVAAEPSPRSSYHYDPVRDWRGVLRGHMPERGEDTPDFSLDHILVGQGAQVLRQRIVRTPEAMDASDHSPVSVDFVLP